MKQCFHFKSPMLRRFVFCQGDITDSKPFVSDEEMSDELEAPVQAPKGPGSSCLKMIPT